VPYLLFDLADIHKPRSSIPLAFRCSTNGDAAGAMRAAMREYLYEKKVMEGMLSLLIEVLSPHRDSASAGDTITADDGHRLPGHKNYAGDEGGA